MQSLKLRALLGVSALAVATSAATVADAQTYRINGGGASLIAPFLRQAADCWGDELVLYRRGSSPLDPTDFNYTGAIGPAQNCAVTHTNPGYRAFYASTGSGRGIGGIFSHDVAQWADIDSTVGDGATTFTVPGPVASPGAGQTKAPVHFALSDAGLGSVEVGIYNNGGTITIGNNVQVAANGGGSAAGPLFFNPLEKYGPLIQIPAVVAPVTIGYDPVYKKIKTGGVDVPYTFSIRPSFIRADGSGGLPLDAATYCNIFNGNITNWNAPAIRALNGNTRLKDPDDTTVTNAQWDATGLPLQIVGRSDSSGTTSIWTRHLANVCTALATPNNAYGTAGNTTLPAVLRGGVFVKNQGGNNPPPVDNPATPAVNEAEVLGKYTLADGNDGVAEYTAFTRPVVGPDGSFLEQGRMAYLGPDFVLPYVLNTGTNAYGLNTATLRNAAGSYRVPSPNGAFIAFQTNLPPESNADGSYNNAAPGDRTDPAGWVQGLSNTETLSNPTDPGAYPIVGTSNFLMYTCYRGISTFGTMYSFLKFYFTSPLVRDTNDGILAEAGFSPLPGNWRNAIYSTFVTDKALLNLEIAKVGTGAGATNPACMVAGVVGA